MNPEDAILKVCLQYSFQFAKLGRAQDIALLSEAILEVSDLQERRAVLDKFDSKLQMYKMRGGDEKA